MTATTIGGLEQLAPERHLEAAMALALLSGLMMLGMGILRLGFLANFLSYPVISGFITASGLVIAASQLKHLLGVPAEGTQLLEIGRSLLPRLAETQLLSLLLGGGVLLFLYWSRSRLKRLLEQRGCGATLAAKLTRLSPVIAIAVSIAISWGAGLADQGVQIIGEIPRQLPELQLPSFDTELWQALLLPALLISLIGFAESISIGQTLAAKRRQRIDPNQELVGLGSANIAASLSGGFPVTGGLSRSVVNFEAGAKTPVASLLTAAGIALTALLLTPVIYYLPKATLAATIIVAVLSLVDLAAMKRTWLYSRSDFAAMLVTVVLTLVQGVELGLIAGIGLSLLLFLYRTSRPHQAVVGRMPNSEHFRNIERYRVETDPRILSLRIDECLYFANSRYLEDLVSAQVAGNRQVRHLILMCPAVNSIDSSALQSLLEINRRLLDSGIEFHLSEVKGPVMDALKRSPLLEQLSGRVFISQYQAWCSLKQELDRPLRAGPVNP
jgi:SulP family sulfate permease